MTDLSSLIESLEKATGPSNDLDYQISALVRGTTLGAGDYTSSIDAAVALANRVLPGWDWGVESFGEDGAQGRVWKHGWHDDTVVRADRRHPAIALLISTLRALQSKGPEA